MVLGEMTYNMETLGLDSDRKIDRSKNLHDDLKSPERSTRKKPLATMIAHAGGAGGGIRQNAKVIKSKNAQLTGTWNAHARIAEISSDLGNILSSEHDRVNIDKKESKKVPNSDDPHLEQSHIDSIEENISLVIDQS
jgi:hypothetical protein